MKLTVLGAGQWYTTPGDVSLYNSAGHLLQDGNTNILLDFGRGCLRTLTQLGVSAYEIDVILISHTHLDHVADVLPLIYAYSIGVNRGEVAKPLTIVGPVGIQDWFTKITALMHEPVSLQITVIEQPNEFKIGNCTITTAEMQHVIPDIAYRITNGSKALVYSGDTGKNENLVQLAHQADLLILECANDPGQITETHLNPYECADIAEAAQVKQLFITHYGKRERQVHIRMATVGRFDGIVTLGEELENITL